MKILIAGAGEVGSHLAKLLSKEEQDVTIIDTDTDRLANLDANYNLLTLRGKPTSFEAISEGGASETDLFIAVTPFETNNLTACAIAKSLGAKRTVARIDNYEYMLRANRDFFTRMGVNHLIYPEYLAAQEIISSLEYTWARNWFGIHDGQLAVVGVKIHSDAKLDGMALKNIGREHRFFHVSAIKRNYETIIPRGDDIIHSGDIVYFTTTSGHIDAIREICGKKPATVRKCLIMGGSRIAVRLCRLAGDKYRFKIIESDRERCEWLAERCPEAKIIHGDARDIDLLIEEGISEMDAFIALTDSSETNILASVSAKELGVCKTVAEVENIQFIAEAENLNVGTIINKKLLASGRIFQILLEADADTPKFMALADADVAQIEVRPGSRITRAPVKELTLNRDMTIAGLIRDEHGMLVTGDTHIRPGDHVVVFCLSGAIHKIERLFT
ncbi:MAG: Trk system potassium transporter TrkA [Pseudoflavonifractor sp.]|nr:Trk system potassium transporter TrkA [Alloprevotella sp.]MCM1117352.1 Trk system potassium transporter TrkA [Pseudoflavonifractor sp.]